MFRFFRKSVMRWLVTFFLMGAWGAIISVASLAFYYSKSSLTESSFKQVSMVNRIRASQVLNYLEEQKRDMAMLSTCRDTTWALERFDTHHDMGDRKPDESADMMSGGYNDIHEEIHKKIDPFFKGYLENHQYENIYLICKEHGHIMYATEEGDGEGTNLTTGPYKNSALAKLRTEIVNRKDIVLSDFTEQASSGRITAFIGAPVFDGQKAVSGIIAAQIDMEYIENIIQKTKNHGWGGETYFVGNDLLLRTHTASDTGMIPLEHKVDIPAVRKALNGENGVGIMRSYQGKKKALVAYAAMNLKRKLGTDFEWAVISEIKRSEAFAPIISLEYQLLYLGLILSVSACVAGYLLSKSITGPLQRLCAKVTMMADGDLTVNIEPGTRIDEIGTLIDAFYYMLGTLRNQTREIKEGSGTIGSSISQLTSTATQLAASFSEINSSVTEITTTVEEVRQTAYVASEKAESVAKDAENAARVAEAGEKATEDAVDGMSRIKEEMEYIAESIVKLSDQTRSIGEIINAVNDLADQSNLLSVNAAIEAAKVGEHGKGFAVVAQEVKSLADQSKEATNQIRNILGDIQKATAAAVMATERGSKAVEKGVHLSGQAGGSINMLSEGVNESLHAAVQIAASSQQQLVGMDQLVLAMGSIEDAIRQNADGARQLEKEVGNLDELGRNLEQLVLMFKA